MKVISWNVNCGVLTDQEGADPLDHGVTYIATQIRNLEPDVVCLQEVLVPPNDQERLFVDQISRRAGLPYYVQTPVSASHLVAGARLGLAILSKRQIDSWSYEQFKNPSITVTQASGEQWHSHDKGLLIARVYLSDGQIGHCVCGHLPPFDTFRKNPADEVFRPIWECVDEILTRHISLPCVGGIDFNTDRIVEFLKVLKITQAFTPLVKMPTRNDGRLHDQILISPHWKQRQVTVFSSRFDHKLCAAELELGGRPQSPHTPNSFSLLHLSDLHFGEGAREDVDWKIFIPHTDREKRRDRLYQYLSQLPKTPTYVVVSGDLTIAGRNQGMSEVVQFLDALINERRFPAADHIIIVPGNHDVTRKTAAGERATEAERWMNFRSAVCERFVTPWFPSLDPGPQAVIEELRERLAQRDEFVGGPSRAIDSRLGKAVRPPLPFVLDRKYGVFIYAFNSAIVSGTKIELPKRVNDAISRLRQDAPRKNRDDLRLVLDAFEKELEIDPSRIDPREINLFNSVTNILQDTIENFDSYAKIAVLHHHVDPVLPEEIAKTENLLNAGRFKFELAGAGFHLILHGHKHWPEVHVDITEDGMNRLIVCGGTIGGGEGTGKSPGFFWLDVPNERSKIDLSFVPLELAGNPRASIEKAFSTHKSYLVGRQGASDYSKNNLRVSLTQIFLQTERSLFGYLRKIDRSAGWSHLLDENRISVMGTAYGLSILRQLALSTTRITEHVPLIVETLLQRRNEDGGWSASSQSHISRPEPTAVVVASLSHWLSMREWLPYLRVLEEVIGRDDLVLWDRTYSLATVSRILAEVAPNSPLLHQCASKLIAGAQKDENGRPCNWSRYVTAPGDASASIIHTAHACIALTRIFHATDGKDGLSPDTLKSACEWMLEQPQWADTAEDINRPRGGHSYDGLVVKHYTRPWVVMALAASGFVGHRRVSNAVVEIAAAGKAGLWDWGELRLPIWATYDAVLALRAFAIESS